MRKSISLLGLGILVLFLVSVVHIDASVSPRCIGAQRVCCYCRTHNWAGAIYGELINCSTPYCPCYTFARIECIFERICLNHTTINYVCSKNDLNTISIWIALSPFGPSNAYIEKWVLSMIFFKQV